MNASSLIPGAIVLHGMTCAWSSKYPPEICLRASGGINFEPAGGPAGHEIGTPSGSCKFVEGRIRAQDPWVRSAGQPQKPADRDDLTRE